MKASSMTVDLPTLEATRELALRIAAHLEPPLTIALEGTLGAGKTQWVRYVAGALGVPESEVTSPTYVLLQQYTGRYKIFHFDFYRLDSEAEVWDLGIDEYYEQSCLVLIEWADKFPACLPDDCLQFVLEQNGEGERRARLTAHGPRARRLLEKI